MFKTIEETLRCLVRFAADTFHEFSRCGPWVSTETSLSSTRPCLSFLRAPFTQYFVEREVYGRELEQGLLVEVGIKVSKLPDHLQHSEISLLLS